MSAASLYRQRRCGLPEVYELLEAEGIRYAIRLPANQVLQRESTTC